MRVVSYVFRYIVGFAHYRSHEAAKYLAGLERLPCRIAIDAELAVIWSCVAIAFLAVLLLSIWPL